MSSTKIAGLQELARNNQRLSPCGASTKSALQPLDPEVTKVDVSGIRRMIEYNPGEYTFTAY